jgi:hypothetical protein
LRRIVIDRAGSFGRASLDTPLEKGRKPLDTAVQHGRLRRDKGPSSAIGHNSRH